MDLISSFFIFLFALLFLIGLMTIALISPWAPAFVWKTFIWIRIYRSGCKIKHISLEDGYRVEYMERGNATSCKDGTILFVHGFSSSKDCFSELIRATPHSYHVIAFDLPGHGGSSAPIDSDRLAVNALTEYMHQVCDDLGLIQSIKPIHLIGYSLGGYVTGLFAARHSQYVKSVSLLCPAGVNIYKKTIIETHFEKTGKILLLPETIDEIPPLIELNSYKPIIPIALLPRFVLKALLHDRQIRGKTYENMLRHFLDDKERYMLDDELKNINAPALLLWGRNDKILDVTSVDVFKKKLRNCKVHIFDKCAHDIMMDRKEDVCAVITQFIGQHSIT